MEDLQEEAKRILTELSAPFTRVINGNAYPDIKWLPKDGKSVRGKIICMPYLSGGQVRDRLNEVLGVDGWMFKSHLETDGARTGTLSIKIGSEWVDRDGVGTKSNQEGEKGADTDSLKRAARQFGIGAYLEKVGPRWVDAQNNRSGKPQPVNKQGKFLYGNALHDHINGLSSAQGLLAQILILDPKNWELNEMKILWEKLK